MRVSVWLCLMVTFATLQAVAASAEAARDEALRQELFTMLREDQALRQQLIAAPDSAAALEVQALDRRNTARLKEIVLAQGWPDTAQVGLDGALAAFVLVQHADQDLAFQEEMLPHVDEAYRRGELPGECVALLTDRILIAKGERQIYGTQAGIVDGVVQVRPVEDPDNLDVRRAQMGMIPIAEYEAILASMYHATVDSTTAPAPGPVWR
jgi:hypothetical protein